MKKTSPACLLPVLMLLVVVFPHQLFAQTQACPPESALLSPDNPIYADAMQLAQTLGTHGFVVSCIFPTKLGSMFMVDENGVLRGTVAGEACLNTNYGAFNVVFMPRPQTFADFKITERRQGGGYLYRFAGTPRVWATNKFGSAGRTFFLKYQNQLLMVSDAQLRARLEEALQLTPRNP